MGLDDVCDTGLVLGLGPLGGGQGEPRSCSAASGDRKKAKNERKPVSSSLNSPDLFEPSLTLGREADNNGDATKVVGEKNTAAAHRRSPHSISSSFCNSAYQTGSVKRERDVGEDDVEAERTLSSRASDEDDDSSAKKKLRLTKEQSALLEERFKEQSTLNPKQKLALAKQLNLRPRQVEVWFQNRRARTKLKQTEVDCEFLKKCCETLSDENRRLQKELQQLKALKLAAPLYMQHTVATLTMCPSCERTGESAADSKHKEGATSAAAFVVGQRPHFFSPFTHPSSAAC